MEWIRLAALRPETAVFDTRSTATGVILRGVDRVVGWDGASDGPAWTLALPNDDLFTCKRLASIGPRLAVAEEPGHGAAALLGFDANGEVAWRTSLGLTLRRDGLAAGGGRFWVLGAAPGKPSELLAVDPASGAIVDRYRVAADQLAGCDDGVAIGWRDGLWWVADGAPERIFDGLNIGDFFVAGREVDFYFEDPDEGNAPSVGRLDTRTRQVVGRAASPADVEEGPCAPAHRFGELTVAAFGEGLGVACFDLRDRRMVWRALQEPKLDVARGAGLDRVWVANTNRPGRLVAVDAQGRSVAPPPTAAKDASFVFAHDGDLLVGGARLTERFRYAT